MLDILISHPEENSGKKRIIRFSDRTDKPIKSLLKSISWRILGTLDTMIISYFITGKATMAVSIGSVEVITKTVLYYFHERIWSHIHRFKIKIFRKENGHKINIDKAKITT